MLAERVASSGLAGKTLGDELDTDGGHSRFDTDCWAHLAQNMPHHRSEPARIVTRTSRTALLRRICCRSFSAHDNNLQLAGLAPLYRLSEMNSFFMPKSGKPAGPSSAAGAGAGAGASSAAASSSSSASASSSKMHEDEEAVVPVPVPLHSRALPWVEK